MDDLLALVKFGVYVILFVLVSKWRRRQKAAAAIKRAGFSLKEGIFLEESRSLLKWGCTQQEALATGAPLPYMIPLLPSGTKKDNAALTWTETALGGIRVSISVKQPEGEGLTCAELYSRSGGNARDQRQFLLGHLVSRLGNPTEVRVPGLEKDTPDLVWRFEGCRLTLFTDEHYGEFTVLFIEREAPKAQPAASSSAPRP